MFDLPLFPLNTVMFPGAPLNLYIFEPRYRLLVRECLSTETPFGVVLIKQGVEAGGPLARPYEIGCSVHIQNVEPLPDGRMNILVIGGERFRTEAYSHAKSYLVGRVENYPFDNPNSPVVQAAALNLRPHVENYVRLLTHASDSQFDMTQLPTDALKLGFVGALILQTSPAQKQTLLEIPDAPTYMQTLTALFRTETALLRVVLQRENDIKRTSHLN